jgi:hypothetical protein
MDLKTTGGNGEGGGSKPATLPRRRRRNSDDTKARFFLPKPGSSLKNPELGQEMASESAALIESLKRDQYFYALTVWKGVAEQNSGNPVIVKQEVADPKAE